MTNQPTMTDEAMVQALQQCTDDQLVGWYLDFRAFMEREAEAQAAFIAPHAAKQNMVQNELHRRLLERNPNWQPGARASGSTDRGTFFLKTNSSIKVADRVEFFQFLIEQPAQRIPEFVTAHVAKEAVEGYMDKHRALPPGVTLERITKLEVRKT